MWRDAKRLATLPRGRTSRGVGRAAFAHAGERTTKGAAGTETNGYKENCVRHVCRCVIIVRCLCRCYPVVIVVAVLFALSLLCPCLLQLMLLLLISVAVGVLVVASLDVVAVAAVCEYVGCVDQAA